MPVCHDCLVVNEKRKFIINTLYLHGTAARVLTSGHPLETRTRVLTYGHSPGLLKHDIEFGVGRFANLYRYSRKWKPWSEQWRTRTA